MSEVFADSFYYIALLNPADRFHSAAVQETRGLRCRLVTTEWVLVEVADALSAVPLRQRTHAFLQHVTADSGTLIITDHVPWYDRAVQLYGERCDKDWSLTDCLSIAVMADRGITDVLTGDHHFVQAGFRALLCPPPNTR